VGVPPAIHFDTIDPFLKPSLEISVWELSMANGGRNE
jgi:hypothetical protein